MKGPLRCLAVHQHSGVDAYVDRALSAPTAFNYQQVMIIKLLLLKEVEGGAELDGGSESGVPPGRNSSRAESSEIIDLLTRLSAFLEPPLA